MLTRDLIKNTIITVLTNRTAAEDRVLNQPLLSVGAGVVETPYIAVYITGGHSALRGRSNGQYETNLKLVTHCFVGGVSPADALAALSEQVQYYVMSWTDLARTARITSVEHKLSHDPEHSGGITIASEAIEWTFEYLESFSPDQPGFDTLDLIEINAALNTGANITLSVNTSQ